MELYPKLVIEVSFYAPHSKPQLNLIGKQLLFYKNWYRSYQLYDFVEKSSITLIEPGYHRNRHPKRGINLLLSLKIEASTTITKLTEEGGW